MFWRSAILALIMSLFLTNPLYPTDLHEDAGHKLARGLSLLGAENIVYRRTYFISAAGTDLKRLARQLESIAATLKSCPADWRLGRGLDETYMVLQVRGEDYRACKNLADLLTRTLIKEEELLGQAWHLECYFREQVGDPADLGQRLVDSLGGSLHSIQVYRTAAYLLAYVAWPGDVILLENGPVNLNLEILHEPAGGSMRLRAGSPVLLSCSYFLEK